MNKEQLMQELRLMVLITGTKAGEKAVDILNNQYIPVQHLCRGEGTATSEILDYLGIGAAEKVVLFSVVPKHKVKKLFILLEERLNLSRLGKGIAFTIPISGSSLSLLKMLSDEHSALIQQLERNVNQMANTITHSLLMVTINQGYSEEVMAAAKRAGATGGTVMHARRAGSEEPMKRWGIRIQQEKEIVFILTGKDKKVEIMKAIGESCGLHSEAHGMIVALPVEAVAGLGDLLELPEM